MTPQHPSQFPQGLHGVNSDAVPRPRRDLKGDRLHMSDQTAQPDARGDWRDGSPQERGGLGGSSPRPAEFSRRGLLRAAGASAAVVGGGGLLEACSSSIKGASSSSSSSSSSTTGA